MAVSRSWGSFFVGVLKIGALPFGIYIKAPDFGKLPYGSGRCFEFAAGL